MVHSGIGAVAFKYTSSAAVVGNKEDRFINLVGGRRGEKIDRLENR
jgi:hypothetical protein